MGRPAAIGCIVNVVGINTHESCSSLRQVFRCIGCEKGMLSVPIVFGSPAHVPRGVKQYGFSPYVQMLQNGCGDPPITKAGSILRGLHIWEPRAFKLTFRTA